MTIAVFILDFIGICAFALLIHLLDLMIKRTGETIGFKVTTKHIPYLTLLFFIVMLILAPYFKQDFIDAFKNESYTQQIIIIYTLTGINLIWILYRKLSKQPR